MINSLAKPVSFIKDVFAKGDERTVKAKKNILFSFLIRGCSILISFVLFPISLTYINSASYGIWLTLSSIVGWFSFFDIGLSHGLRNKFAEAKAKGDDDTAQIYVSTTYAILGIIFSGLWILFIIVNQFIDWSKILKIPENMHSEVSVLAVIVFTYFCLQFVLNIITTIFTADQQPARSSLINVFGQVLSLLTILVLVKTTQGSLLRLGIVFCASPIIVFLAAHFVLFRGRYKRYRPLFSRVDFSYARKLFNLGVKFFVIQVAAVIQFETANIIIARNFGTAEVTSYNVVYKYFSITNMIFFIFLTPFWSACTDAYIKNDIQWIKNGMKKYNLLNIILTAAGALMLIFSGSFYKIWLHGKVSIEFILSFWGFVYFNVTMFGGKYVYFLNGISALRIQFWSSIISPFLYILIVLVLIDYYKMGVYALFVASILANFNGYILSPLQYYQIIVKNKKGIWIK